MSCSTAEAGTPALANDRTALSSAPLLSLRRALPSALRRALTRAPGLVLALALTLAWALTLASPPARAMVDARVDRAYGYLIGDTVTTEAAVPIPPGMDLDDRSLPSPGRVNGWLHLLDVDARRLDDHLVVRRRFLVTASAESVRLVWLPRVALRFVPANGGVASKGEAASKGEPNKATRQIDALEQIERIDVVGLTISPITAATAFARNGLGDLRPDRGPPLPDLARLDRGLAATLAVLLVAAAVAALARWRLRRADDGAPFRRAARELARLDRRGGGDAVGLGLAYRALHQAFDRSAGQTLMSADIDDFLRLRPRLDTARDAIAAFFARSDARFFSTPASTPAPDPTPGPDPAAGRAELRALRELARRLASAAG